VVDGRPVNPCESTRIRYGRNDLGHWGEQLCADAFVTAIDKAGGRWIVLVERRDGHGWALPGGYVDPGEHPLHAAIRETKEEASLSVALRYWRETKPRYVPDPRGSDEAWMVTVPCVADLGIVDRLPTVVGRSDARRAIWGPAVSYETMAAHLATTYGGTVFTAHKDMLSDFFAGRL
jgi:8-oxo-dGTP pyrophosphatase MutT (NUDIX family)